MTPNVDILQGTSFFLFLFSSFSNIPFFSSSFFLLESLNECIEGIQAKFPILNKFITKTLTRKCVEVLQQIKTIPAQYRMTNKEVILILLLLLLFLNLILIFFSSFQKKKKKKRHQPKLLLLSKG